MNSLGKFFDYKTREQQIAEKWKNEGFYRFNKEGSEKLFKIDTPPPTVSGFLHMGHVFSYVQADVIARYKRMMGFNVFYPIGFDDNGLPTERLVEKKTGKKVGKNASKEEFITECWKVVTEAEQEFEELFCRIGLSVDFSLKYQTISAKTASISQDSFIDLYNKGLVYKKLAPVYWDVVDKTALAQADIEDKEKEGIEITYKALIGENEVEIMTTRAEMLPACVCVLYNPKDQRYSHFKGKKILLPANGKECFLEVDLISDEDVLIEKGTGLVMCCAFGDMQDKTWIERHNLWDKIKTWNCNLTGSETKNLISDNGFLNSSFFKKEDGKAMKVEEGRRFMAESLLEAGLISGSGVKMTFEEAFLNPLIKVNKIKHNIKCGERSGEPVEILFKNQWYLSILPFKKDFLLLTEKINFHPAHMKVRLEKWIEGLNQDWCISRDRFFGIEIPVRRFVFEDAFPAEAIKQVREDFYQSTLKPLIQKFNGKMMENYFEMESKNLHDMMEGSEYLSFEDSFALNGFDLEVKNIGFNKYKIELHRDLEGVFNELLEDFNTKIENGEFILKTEDAEKLLKSIEEKSNVLAEIGVKNLKIEDGGLVFDTWFTSSISPQVAWKDLDSCPVFNLRPQAHEIIRTWTFYTIVKTYLHSLELKAKSKKPISKDAFNPRLFFRMKENPNIIPWKNVMLSGWCLAADKTKMSKSKGNVVTPLELISKKGVDSIRLWCSSASLGADVAYNEELLEGGTRFINKLWNSFNFFSIKKDELKEDAEITERFDKWILSQLSLVIKGYIEYMEAFEYSKAKELLENFFWKDFCDNYLEIIKVRYYGLDALIYKENPPQNKEDILNKQQSAIKTLKFCLLGVLILSAPFTPFVTEELSIAFFKKSVHLIGSLASFKVPSFESSDEDFKAIKVIEAVRKHKAENSLSMNSKMESFEIDAFSCFKFYEEDLKNVTGVKEFNFINKNE